MISWHFANWVKNGTRPSILPSQVNGAKKIMDRLSNGDLICVMYHGSDELSLKALKMLKSRFEDELHALEELV